MKSRIAILILILVGCDAAAQRFSIASDLSLMRQSKEPTYFALVQTIQPSFAVSRKTSLYLSIANSSIHKSELRFVATARADSIQPKTIPYIATTSWRTRQFSGGLKQYIIGGYKSDGGIGLYVLAGVGIMSVKLENAFSRPIDTLFYHVAEPSPGHETMNRWSYDLGLGFEKSMTPNFYWYIESKAWLHRDNFSSPYMFEKNVTIMPLMFGAGLRVLFGYFQ
jgi:hypothetical protein